jgi:hypothetical protein
MDQEQFNNEVNAIVKSRVGFVERNYLHVREAYETAYDWPAMDTLRHEISLSIIFGMCQAAITLTNHLLESLLKTSLIFLDAKEGRREKHAGIVVSLVRMFTPGKNKYGGQNLSKNIDSAFSLGLITEDEKKVLHKFRVRFRNAYSHSDKEKTFGDREITGQGLHIEDGKFILDQHETARIADLGIVQGLAQAYQAQVDAIPYFLYMDHLTRAIRGKMFPSSGPAAAS